LIVGWCGRFFFFVVPRQFSQVGEWSENQILIADWTYYHCPGTTLVTGAEYFYFLLSLVNFHLTLASGQKIKF